MSRVKVALIQMRSGTDPERNLDDAEAMIREAAGQGAKFVLTPETTNLVQKDTQRLFETLKSPVEDPAPIRFARLAEALKIDLLAGSFALLGADGRAVNRSHLFGPDGEVKALYDKIHMFDVEIGGGESWKESANYKPGDRAAIADAAGMKVGLSICYDLRFPYLYRRLAQAGALALTVPSAFTRPTGRAHWEVLLRARAIETGSWVLAPAQGGRHEDGRKTWGHSMVVGPWGEVVGALSGDDPGILYAEIDAEEALEARRRIPALSHDREITGPGKPA
ncbi:carbon-nitrogen hydrolase family protein [Marinicauda algicola]|uniref:Carbon-nitrogen hydrolase family protein n=1 Tax=Marinicauda algicola TaxID=2029849 RepID=A0A4S2H3L2_9PROT|nr:carbon-nitrogen hydrolase family protein [Marinicauda algicola]TGY90230.1 carbon-nitrogen hydrolase family protein [Marinicauda algicola]